MLCVGLGACRPGWKPEAVGDPTTAGPAYPEAPRGGVEEVLHGVRVPDPYRWLEDLDSEQTRAWVAAQNALASDYLGRIAARRKIRERLAELWSYERQSIPVQRGGRYFFTRREGLQDQPVLYWSESLDEEPRLLLDANLLSEDGTVALRGWAPSEDGRRLAYGLSSAGSDWQEWRVREVDTGLDLEDRLQWLKFSRAAWTHDGAGFFYSRYDPPDESAAFEGLNYYQKLYYHRIGSPQADDRLVYERRDRKEWGFAGRVSDDGRYLVIGVWQGSLRRNAVFYRDLEQGDGRVVELLADFDARYEFVGNDGPIFFLKTDLDAPLSRLVAIDTRDPERSHWREIIPESRDVLQSVGFVADRFIGAYLRDAQSRVEIFDRAGRPLGDLALPGVGSAGGFGGRRGDRETFYSFTSYTTPSTIFRYDLDRGESSVLHQPDVDFDPLDYETRQVFYTSGDGTRVPMFIAHRKGIERDGSNPTYLQGYGGFRASVTPRFSLAGLVWMELGGVLAQPNLRGGGEYGRAWHEAGIKLRKQNVFDDFIAAAEWLIESGYTSAARLAIGGRSNGGLLVGAALTQRPDLFGACLPSVGVLDMLRFHKFTIGWAWTSDYGSPEDPEEFEALLAYSPYHNVRTGTVYPPTLITTADHDDRVFPAHSYKFAAALQAAQAGPGPVLIRVEERAGHGAGKPTEKVIAETADRWAFAVAALRVPLP